MYAAFMPIGRITPLGAASGVVSSGVVSSGGTERGGPERRLLCACDLPALLAVDDNRGRVVALRELVKRWACLPEQRAAMIQQAPRRHRFYDRWFSVRRYDLARIAAVVHALCDRDGVAAPGWVSRHRARRPIGIVASFDPGSEYGRAVLADAPEACAVHGVWFDQTMIENVTVHGFRDRL